MKTLITDREMVRSAMNCFFISISLAKKLPHDNKCGRGCGIGEPLNVDCGNVN
jgi:hypothetical protein